MGNDSFVYGCRSVFQLDLDTIKFWIFDYHINHFCLLILFYYMYNVFFTIFKIVHNKFTSVGFSLSQA